MIKRPILAAACASAALVCAFGLTGRSVEAQGAGASIGTATASPNRLPGTGGSVTVSVTVTPARGAVVRAVRASATVPGSRTAFGSPVTLSQVGRTRTYRGTLSIQANPARRSATSYIQIQADTSRGLVTRQTGTVAVSAGTGGSGGGGGDTPPAPPNI